MFEKADLRKEPYRSIPVALRTDWALKERSLARSGTHFSCRQALIARLVTLEFVEVFTEPRAGLVQLRLRIAYRASQYIGNLVVFLPLNIVQDKYCAVADGQPLDAAFEIYSVKRSIEQQVRRPNIHGC